MKTISVVIPTYNEEAALMVGYHRVKQVLTAQLSTYRHEIVFIDNHSTDGTRSLLRLLAAQDASVKVIFNGNNVGWSKSSFYGILNATGDCVILLSADMQEPPEAMTQFIKYWEEGSKIVIGIKNKSEEGRFIYFLRNCYYSFMKRFGDVEHIQQFMGFGLYDKSFIKILRELNDPIPYLRGIIAELGFGITRVPYVQEIRKQGKTHWNFLDMYDLAMLGITSYSKIVMRLATLCGFGLGILCFIVALITLACKMLGILDYPIGIAAIAIGLFFLGGVELFFIGLLGEYILNINTRVMRRPLVIEEERLNFNQESRVGPDASIIKKK